MAEFIKSKLELVYPNEQSIIDKSPVLQIFDKTLSYSDIKARIANYEFIASRPKCVNVDGITSEQIQTAIDWFKRVPKIKETAVVSVLKLVERDNITMSLGTVVNGQYFPPKMMIDLSNETFVPGSGVRINTGYVLKIENVAESRVIKKRHFVRGPPRKQCEFVIVPVITSNHGDVIPSIYARDQEDTGLLTINFVTKVDKLSTLEIVFYAYKTRKPLNSANLISGAPTDVLFKPKDSRSGRCVKNPKVKVYFNRAKYDEEQCVLPTFNALVKPIVEVPGRHVQIANTSVLFTSRKREWADQMLLTLSGGYLKNGGTGLGAVVTADSEYNNNTHGMTFIEGKIMLFGEPKPPTFSGCRIINGAFMNHDKYFQIRKFINLLDSTTQSLAGGYQASGTIANRQGLDQQQVFKICDYYYFLPMDDTVICELVNMPENKWYEIVPDKRPKPLSVEMIRALQFLAYTFCSLEFTDGQLEEMKLAVYGPSSTKEEEDAHKILAEDLALSDETDDGDSKLPDEDSANKRPAEEDASDDAKRPKNN